MFPEMFFEVQWTAMETYVYIQMVRDMYKIAQIVTSHKRQFQSLISILKTRSTPKKLETSPQNPPSATQKSVRNFLPRTPANDLKITLFGIGRPKGWRKAWIFEWTFFLNLGGPETQCD